MSLRAPLRAFFALAALGALLWLLDRIGWRQVADTLARVGPASAAILVALGVTESLLDAMALRVTIDGRIGPARMLGYHTAGALMNMVVPLEAGEVLKGTLLQRHVPAHDAITGTIIWNYIFKITRPGMALVAALAGIAAGSPVDSRIKAMLLGAVALAFVPYFLLRLALRGGMAVAMVRVGKLFRIVRKDPQVWLDRATQLDHAVRSFWDTRRSDFLRVLRLQLLARFCSWMSTLVVLRTLGLDVGFGTAALLHASLSSAEYLLLFLPARVGVAEGAAFFVFRLYGFDPTLGVVAALVVRLRSIAANLIGASFMIGRRP